MSKGGRFAKKSNKPQKQSKGGVAVLAVVTVVLALVVAGLIGNLIYRANREAALQAETTQPTIPQTQAIPEETSEPTTEPTTVPTTLPYEESGKDIINILVVGQSARAGEQAENHRLADSMILVTVNKNTKVLTLTSFFRDTYVELPDFVDTNGKKHYCGQNRINVAYHLGYKWGGVGGSMEMMNQCLLDNFGIEVDHNIEIDFEGFIDLIDMLGGIEVTLTEDEAEYLNNDDQYVYYDVEPGEVTLDGCAALSYARMRHSNAGDSDYKRTARQRQMVSAMLEKLKTRSFGTLQKLVNAALPMITTNMTDEEITTCIWEILPLLPELTIETGTCPVEGTYSGKIIDLFGVESSVITFIPQPNIEAMKALTEGVTAQTEE